jgi:hypothetical protein
MPQQRRSAAELPGGLELFVTVHPSLFLRVLPADREAEFGRFVEDMRALRRRLHRLKKSASA